MTVSIIFWGINLFTVNCKYWIFAVVTVLLSKKEANAFFFQLFHTIPCCQPKFVAQILSKNGLFVFFLYFSILGLNTEIYVSVSLCIKSAYGYMWHRKSAIFEPILSSN